MITIEKAIWLGIVQGLTEFLPISSSGHLVLFQNLMGMSEPMLAFDVAVHLGTLLAVFLYFAKDICRMVTDTFAFLIRFPGTQNREALYQKYPYSLVTTYVIVATIPTIMVVVIFEEALTYLFSSLLAVGIAWIMMSFILMASRKFQIGDRPLNLMNSRDAFIIGVAQGIAVIPGISRSGSTILAGMAMGLERGESAKFSFWIAIPAIIAAGTLQWKEGLELYQNHRLELFAGFGASAVTGLLAIAILLQAARRGKLYLFGYYCFAIGSFTIIYCLKQSIGF